jgi:hypothetical protein
MNRSQCASKTGLAAVSTWLTPQEQLTTIMSNQTKNMHAVSGALQNLSR